MNGDRGAATRQARLSRRARVLNQAKESEEEEAEGEEPPQL
jgi:hypothetical protein